MNELKITKAKVSSVMRHSNSTVEVLGDFTPLCTIKNRPEQHANAELIADAFNTANACNLLPSELLRQRDMLINEIEGFIFNCIETGKVTENQIAYFKGRFRNTINQVKP